ncbi:DoxX [Corynebacterium capitovis DSM 44611]|uniref:DoxX family membrane protein n=1 Tax=Corynebacterium capitovis TaxID=131081 RepID=UPI0003770A5E|nr:DoxX family membrane protein [Corynebacterium capitovis]WKD57748.1 DoxX [Corynebacterium capitovis DSM 44611]
MIRKFARPMLASVYVIDGVETVLNPGKHKESAESTLKKVRAVVPAQYRSLLPSSPETAAQIAGGVKTGAGALFALGKAPRTAAALLAATAVPSLIGRNAFWEAKDAEEKARRRSGAITDAALLGGVLLATVDTAGKPDLQWRAQTAAKAAKKNVQQALPTQSEAQKATAKASGWLSDATEQVTSYVDDNKDDWKKAAAHFADNATDVAGDLFEDAKKQTSHFFSAATDQAQNLKPVVDKRVSDLQSQLDSLAPSSRDKARAKKKAAKTAAKVQGRAQDAVDSLQSAFANLDAAPSKRQRRKWDRTAKKAQKRAEKAVKRAQKKFR